MAKKEIFSRFNLKDYNKELEEILDKKDFSSQAKNLLLSMLYKLEIGYKDYAIVKSDSISKEMFLENIMNIIKEKCDKIELIKPNEDNLDERKYYAYPEEKKISCYQNEATILHALLELDEKNFIIQNTDDIIKNPIQTMLKEGYELDITESVTDFDGWSWNNNLDKGDPIDFFLIYETLRILMGNDFLYEWKKDISTNTDYLKEIRKKSKDLCEAICKYCILKTALDEKNRKEITNELKKLKIELAEMENKTVFLKEKYDQKKELSEKIKIIDKILNNKNLLKEEFDIRNSKLSEKDKIFSLSDLEEIIQKERENAVSKNNEVNKILDPKNYLKRMEKLQDEIDLVEQSGYKKASTQILEKELVNLQKIFIEVLKKVLTISNDKKQIQELIYKFRYYLYLPIKINDEIINIKDVEELKQELEKTESRIITKACKQRALIIINQDIRYNAKIMRKIINTKIIELSSITAAFTKKENVISINIFDGEVLDRTETIEKDKEKDFKIKFEKKTRLFI